MRLTVTAPAADFEVIPDGEVLEVELLEVTSKATDWGDRLTWVFTVTEQGPWSGRRVYGNTSAKFVRHSECRAYNWASSMTGDKYEDADTFDTEDLHGRPARVIVRHSPDRKDPDKVWQNVDDVLPPKQARNVEAQTSPF